MTTPKSSKNDKSATSILAAELERAKKREKKLEAALHEVFPVDLYTQVRPDVKEAYHGEPKKTTISTNLNFMKTSNKQHYYYQLN